MQRVAVLGATGSIGRNAADVLAANRDRYTVSVLAANRRIDELARLGKRLSAGELITASEELLPELRRISGGDAVCRAGAEAMEEAVRREDVDIVLCAIIGIEQLLPCEFIYRLEYVVGLIFVISLTTVMVRAGTWYVNMTLSNGSFFIFAYHYMLLGFIIWLYGTDTFTPHSAWLALLMYVLAVAVVVFFGLIFYWLMRTRLPFITYILMGGRR